ncbi:MAG: hypothetical protein PHY27_04845 [Parabacteroides sp.]|nr:hypothetical protein [Parabacteroides sp.]
MFANEEKCNHILSFKDQGIISWIENKIKFALNDTVYVFVSSDKRIRYKTKVVAVNCRRRDAKYWYGIAPNDTTSMLQLVQEFSGNELDEQILLRYGFKGGRSIQSPMCNNPKLFEYIDSVFNSK